MQNSKFKQFLLITLIVFCLAFVIHFSNSYTVFADEYDDLGKQIQQLQEKMEMSKNATTPLEATLSDLESRIASIRATIVSLSNQLTIKEKEVAEGEQAFALNKAVLDERIRTFYIDSRSSCELCSMILGNSLGTTIRLNTFTQTLVDSDKEKISEIVLLIKNLETKREDLKVQSKKLAGLQTQIDSQAQFYRKEIKGAKDYQADLSRQIATLTARQQAIISAKVGLFSTTVGEVPLSDDPASRPDYNPGFSPAFGAFSFGAPHFKGMSQYGAFGRAKSGQSAEDILRAYYGTGVEIKKDYSTDITIQVSGFGGFSIEDYAKRIYEMPSSWADEGGMEALKAQAVAARSYALARTNNGSGSICATEACQVFKSAPKGGKWEEAVNATRGWVLIANGAPFSAWYSSTSGGYQESYSHNGHSTPGFWDTKSGRNGWTSEAYEKIAGSPWFYKGWYKTRSGTSCGRSHPWLTNEEFSDIVNAAIVLSGGGDTSGILPLDSQSCFGGSGDAWSRERVKSEADSHGGGVTSVSSVSVQYRDDGRTGNVIVNGKIIDGQVFYKAFNLRAPGAIHLKSGLFNIEKK